MSRPGAAPRRPIFIRTLRMEAQPVSDDELEVTGRLLDERPDGGRWFGMQHGTVIHDLSVTLRVRHPDLIITRVVAEMTSRPYTVCADAIEPLQQLVGLSIARGFTRALNERFGRQAGCAHLTALIHAMGPVVRQGAGVAFRDENEIPTREQDLWFVNSCQAWREHGLLHQRLMANDVPGLRALTARSSAAP